MCYTKVDLHYLAEGSGNTSGRGAFRALQRGFNHWSSGRLSNLEINTHHPSFCHVRCTMTPSMKAGIYNVAILLERDSELAIVKSATCQCAAGLSASCTHVSGLLHALTSITESEVAFGTTSSDHNSNEEEALPITSYSCHWKVPKKRKESTLPFAEATFTKHVYGTEKKHTLKPLEEFDPRPEGYKGTAKSHLPELLDTVRGKRLSISLSLDPRIRFWKPESTSTPLTSEDVSNLPSKDELRYTVSEFKKRLHLPSEKLRDIEQLTRDQSHSSLWCSV